jgi:acetyl esterase
MARCLPMRSPRGALVVALLALAMVSPACSGDDDVSVTKNITYGDYQGQALQLDRYESDQRPVGSDDAGRITRAAVVMFHGGGWAGGDKGELASTARGFARAGFVAFSVNYAIPPAGERVPAEIDTTRMAVHWVMDNAESLGVDPDRVGLFGASAGGNLALMVALQGIDGDRPPIKAVASWSGPTDLSVLAPPDGQANPDDPPIGCAGVDDCIGVLTPQVFTDYVGCTLADCPDSYAALSPVTWATEEAPPAHLTASEADFVPFDQATRLADALQGAGAEAETLMVPGDDHAQDLADDALEPTVEFFGTHLGRTEP